MFKRFLAILIARTIEFWRDRAALAWNFIFPILLVVGFGLIFSGGGQPAYKVGLIGEQQTEFVKTKYIQFVDYQADDQSVAKAILKLQQHRLDLLVDSGQRVYWINDSSPSGYIVEKLLLQVEPDFTQQLAQGAQIRYVDWVLPGILAMNMMFSCLFGVGYVVVLVVWVLF